MYAHQFLILALAAFLALAGLYFLTLGLMRTSTLYNVVGILLLIVAIILFVPVSAP